MPLPFISTLSRAARRAYPMLEAGVARGLSANANIAAYLAGGGQIRRQTGLDMIRRIRGVEDLSSRVRNIRPEFTPDPRRIPEALTKLRRAFSFRVRLRGTDISTGDDFERFVNISLNKPTNRALIERMAEAFQLSSSDRYGMDLDEVQLVGAVKAGDLGTLK